jgi:hypothetical protein
MTAEDLRVRARTMAKTTGQVDLEIADFLVGA